MQTSRRAFLALIPATLAATAAASSIPHAAPANWLDTDDFRPTSNLDGLGAVAMDHRGGYHFLRADEVDQRILSAEFKSAAYDPRRLSTYQVQLLRTRVRRVAI